MDFAKTMIFTIAALGFAIWVGMILATDGSKQLEMACKPVHIGTIKLQEVTTALVGYVPNWTVSFRKFLEGGCNYFFSVILQGQDDVIGGGVGDGEAGGVPPSGGVRL